MNKELVKKVKKSFKNHFKTTPVMVFSPGRINLIGEHTDYNDGFVFPAAINKGIVLGIQKNDSEESHIYALDKKEQHSFSLSKVAPISKGGWKNYVLGVVAEIQQLGIELHNFDIAFAGNIPGGAGMSSSAALENSVVYVLNTLFNLGLSKHQMILISQQAEHNFVGVQCGIMDQYASMFGKKKKALLLDCRSLQSKQYAIDFKKYRILLINTNVKHDLSESAYNDRRLVCENVSKKLGVKALRDVSLSQIEDIKEEISNDDYQKAKYVIEENSRVKKFTEAIENNDLDTLGALLFASHKGLSSQFKVSCKELDFLVEKAQNSAHVLGARIMGGGFGGCTINLVLKKEATSFAHGISKDFIDQFGRACSIYKVKLSKGTHSIK